MENRRPESIPVFSFGNARTEQIESSSTDSSKSTAFSFGNPWSDISSYAPPKKIEPTFNSLAYIIEDADFGSFVSKMKKAKTDDVDSLSDELRTLQPYAVRAGPASTAAARLLGTIQQKTTLENMFPELMGVISTHLNDPNHLRNLGQVSKTIFKSTQSIRNKAANTAPLTTVEITGSPPDGSGKEEAAKEMLLLKRFWRLFNGEFKSEAHPTTPPVYLQLNTVDRIIDFSEGADTETQGLRDQKGLYDNAISFKEADLLQLEDLFEPGIEIMDLDQLKAKLLDIRRFLGRDRTFVFDVTRLEKITTLPPLMKELAINRLRAYIAYATVLISQARQWVMQIREAVRDRFKRDVIYPLARIDPHGCGRLRDAIFFESEMKTAEYVLDPVMNEQYTKTASRLEREYLKLFQQARLFAADAIFGLPYNNQNFSDWLRPLAIEWIISYSGRLVTTLGRPGKFWNEEGLIRAVAKCIAMFMLTRRLAPYICNVAQWDTPDTGYPEELSRIYAATADVPQWVSRLVFFMISFESETYLPFHWKKAQLAARMRDPNFYQTKQQEEELRSIVNKWPEPR